MMAFNLDSRLNGFNFLGTGQRDQFREPVVINRYALEKTWWTLLTKLAGKHPNMMESKMIEFAFFKIQSRMMQMTDAELLDDMQDIIEAIDYVSLDLPIKRKVHYK